MVALIPPRAMSGPQVSSSIKCFMGKLPIVPAVSKNWLWRSIRRSSSTHKNSTTKHYKRFLNECFSTRLSNVSHGRRSSKMNFLQKKNPAREFRTACKSPRKEQKTNFKCRPRWTKSTSRIKRSSNRSKWPIMKPIWRKKPLRHLNLAETMYIGKLPTNMSSQKSRRQ